MSSDVVTSELTIDGLPRRFMIRLPRSSASAQPPLVLVLHGNHPGAGGALMRDWTTFDQQADAWGLAIAYPDGVGGCWADGRGVTTADEAGVDDVAFLRALIDASAELHGTAPDRVVVAGISNGAFMAHHLALAASDQVAVLAAVAGGLPAALLDRAPTHAVSAMLINGTADRIVPIEGGYSRHRGPDGEPRGRVLSLHDTAERWRAINRCSREQTHTTEGSSRTTSDGGVGGASVVAWTVFGGGHTWPGRPTPPEWSEPTSVEFDAAVEVCRFADPLLTDAATRRL